MTNIPTDRKYSRQHGWVKIESAGTVRLGITDHLQTLIGFAVYVDLPRPGAPIQRLARYATVESDALTCELPNRSGYAAEFAKLGEGDQDTLTTDLMSPLTGKVSAVNSALEENPDLVNSDPYGDGWLGVIDIADDFELNGLLSSIEYAQMLTKCEGESSPGDEY